MSVRRAFAFLCCLLSPIGSLARNGAYRSTAHGDSLRGPHRRADVAAGSCMQCHEQHSGAQDARLFAPNDNELCLTCHNGPSESGTFPGGGRWLQATHATTPNAGRCVSCHEPHGVRDSRGVIPSMLDQREPELCVTCHNGSRAADIRSQLTRAYVHGAHTRGEHDPHESNDPAAYAAFPADKRHVTCSDCHNVHRAMPDVAPPSPPDASNRLAGVSRVEVVPGEVGIVPVYLWHGPDDPAPANEYEVCFKCHSSWTKQPPGQSDLARLTSPGNPSFHPIQEIGKNRNVAPESFANGYSADSRIRCTDCHGSDDPHLRGPHGSSYPHLLKKSSTSSAMRQAMAKDELCFDCHAWSVYADPAASAEVQQASRFNAPAGQGHAFHVGRQQIPCFACHETHGSTRNAALISTSRPAGITTFVEMPSGGRCGSACHASRSYSLNYAR